jgi:hypothetical protein
MSAKLINVGLVVSLIANVGLGAGLAWTWVSKLPAVRHHAWRYSCPKVAMQHHLYQRAREHAQRTGKQLVVIGNPSGGWVNKVLVTYGCGDVCIDLMGCTPCEKGVRILKQDATAALRSLPDDSAVVFESGVFELVDDMKETVKQIDRLTGGDLGRVYSIHDINLDAWAYHTRGVRPQAPSRADLERRRKNRMGYAKTGEGLAKRIIYRFPPQDRYAWTEL